MVRAVSKTNKKTKRAEQSPDESRPAQTVKKAGKVRALEQFQQMDGAESGYFKKA